MAETGKTNLRIPLQLKQAAMAKARREYRTLTDVVVQGLREYVGDGGPAPVPERQEGAAKPPRATFKPPEADCPHPKARVHKGFCGACGQPVGSAS